VIVMRLLILSQHNHKMIKIAPLIISQIMTPLKKNTLLRCIVNIKLGASTAKLFPMTNGAHIEFKLPRAILLLFINQLPHNNTLFLLLQHFLRTSSFLNLKKWH